MKYLPLLALSLLAGCAGTPAEPSGPSLPALLAGRAPGARMFIDIGLQVLPEADPDRPSDQATTIKSWQDKILAALAGEYDPVTVTQYRTLPALALDLTPDGLLALNAVVAEYALTPGNPPLRVARDPDMRTHSAPASTMKEAISLTRVDGLQARFGGTDQVVVVIDDGVSEAFEVTAGKVVQGGFITSGKPHPCHSSTTPVKMCFESKEDGYPLTPPALPNHGTQMAAVTCGTLGIAPRARCFSIRVADEDGNMLFSDVLEALEVFFLDWQPTYPNATVNLSLGISKALFDSVASCDASLFAPATKLACKNLVDKGCPVVVSAGNDGAANATAFPACLEEVLTVGATTKTLTGSVHERSPFSNWGPLVDITAPGVNMLMPTSGIIFGLSPGTSIAAPQVAGALMLLREGHPSCDVSKLRQAILESPSAAGEDMLPFLDGHSALTNLNALCPGTP